MNDLGEEEDQKQARWLFDWLNAYPILLFMFDEDHR